MTTIKFAKVKENAIIPSKREGDGCYDIYACFDDEAITIKPHECKLIPTGICSTFDNNYRIGIRERGSNTKAILITVAGQIDSSFRGEWFVALYNANHIPIEITKNVDTVKKYISHIQVPYTKAIAQFAVEEVPKVEITESTYDEIQSDVSERGKGMLGSSNK